MTEKIELFYYDFGTFRLDGGAMFGSVPKTIWSNKIPADEKNRIPLATKCLILKTSSRCILIDTGNGSKWDEKYKDIYAIEYKPLPNPEIITDVILTHLHFDHAGGISYYDSGKNLKLTYPNASVYLQKENYANALKPNLKERASYLRENVEILDKANLNLIDGSTEIFPGIWAHKIDGHTIGQQYVEIRAIDQTYFFATDLIPTHHHLPVAYHMGYDLCGNTVMREKQEFLDKVMLADGTVIFQHDASVTAGKIEINNKGHFSLKKEVALNPYPFTA